jgi:hypothetical protein
MSTTATDRRILKKLDLKQSMVEEARERYGTILPCGSKRELADCFTEERSLGIIIFWFRAPSQSTRVVVRRLNGRPYTNRC